MGWEKRLRFVTAPDADTCLRCASLTSETLLPLFEELFRSIDVGVANLDATLGASLDKECERGDVQ